MPPVLSQVTRHNGATIRCFRVKAGKTLTQLAEEAECSTRTLRTIETEQGETSPELLSRIARALDVPMLALVRHPDHAYRTARIAS